MHSEIVNYANEIVVYQKNENKIGAGRDCSEIELMRRMAGFVG